MSAFGEYKMNSIFPHDTYVFLLIHVSSICFILETFLTEYDNKEQKEHKFTERIKVFFHLYIPQFNSIHHCWFFLCLVCFHLQKVISEITIVFFYHINPFFAIRQINIFLQVPSRSS